MNKYESVFITRQDFSTVQIQNLNEKLKNLIEDLGGTIAKTEYWGLRSLAYRVKKNNKGHYVLLQIQSDKNVITEYTRHMNMHEDILRQITIKVDVFEQDQSAILRNRDEKSRVNRRSSPIARQS